MRANFLKFCNVLVTGLFICIHACAQSGPMLHAHNDYTRKHPLFSALEAGIHSIEIDVYYHKGRVAVSHIPLFLGAKKDLPALYGTAFRQAEARGMLPPQLTIMLDIKSGHDSTTFYALQSILRCTEGIPGTQFRILLTGGYKREQAALSGIAGIVFDAPLGAFLAGADIPPQSGRLSCSYSSFRKAVKELGEKTVQDRLALASAQGIQTRVWGAGNRIAVWTYLCNMGISIINCDKYAKARHFLSQYPANSPANIPAH